MPDSPLCDKETLVRILDSLEAGIIFVDNKNDLVFINKSAEEIRMMKSEERLGTSILDCHNGRLKARVSEVMKSFQEGNCVSRHKMIKTNNKYFDNIYNVVKDSKGNFLGVVLLSQDVTDKKNLEEKLRLANEELEEKVKQRTEEIQKAYEQLKIAQLQLMQTEKMSAIGQFVSGLAHEINNPLDGVQNCLRAILHDPANIEQTKSYSELALEGLYRIEMLVQKLLSYAKNHVYEKTLININEVLEDILSLTGIKLKTKKITLIKELDNSIPPVFGDYHFLEQTFVNLIINAFDAMNDGGELKVKTSLAIDGSVKINVSDTGCGIPKENLSRIFDPFFTTKQKSNGTGLGLYLTYNVISQHRGKISVKSKEGKGTEFTVLLPSASDGKETYEKVEMKNESSCC